MIDTTQLETAMEDGSRKILSGTYTLSVVSGGWR
jgi:hypothetical protein